MNRLRKIVWGVIFCLLTLSGLLYYAYQNAFRVPAPILNHIRSLAIEESGVDFDADSFRLNVKEHTLKARKLRIMTPGNPAFAEIDEAFIHLASGTGPLDFYHNRRIVEKIAMKGLVIDPASPLPKKRQRKIDLDRIPSREITVEGIKIKTPLISVDVPGLYGQLLRSGRNASFDIDLGSNFIGGKGRLLGVVDLIDGNARARLNWKQGNLASFIPLMLLSHFYGLSVGSGSAEIALQWEGNLARRIEEPEARIPDLINHELKGHLHVKNCGFLWSGKSGLFDFSASRNDKQNWQISARIADEKGSLGVSGEYRGNDASWWDFAGAVDGRNLELTTRAFARLGLTLANTVPGKIDFSGDFIGRAGRVSGSGFARAAEWKYQQKHIDNASLTWRLDEDYTLSSAGRLETEIGRVNASAAVKIAGSQKWHGRVEGILEQIDLQSLKPFIESPVARKMFRTFCG
jgi:hypothetical protein